jgi:3-oxoacyl-[acyl-carrier-protein] synthase-1
LANAACGKGYAPGPRILCHVANDGGERVAAVLRYGTE